MEESIVADTQYGDSKGTVSFDGHDGQPLHELARLTNMPKGYWPLGFEISRMSPIDSGMIPFQIIAVKMKHGVNNNQNIIDKANNTRQLHVYRFDGQMKPEQFDFFYTRIDIKAIHQDYTKIDISVSHPEKRS